MFKIKIKIKKITFGVVEVGSCYFIVRHLMEVQQLTPDSWKDNNEEDQLVKRDP